MKQVNESDFFFHEKINWDSLKRRWTSRNVINSFATQLVISKNQICQKGCLIDLNIKNETKKKMWKKKKKGNNKIKNILWKPLN